jgi:AcrR family transcriptional regulator
VSTGDRVLDAVGEILGAGGWPDVTMAAVARAAGVSRQTLYKRFGSRAALAQAYVLREAARLVALVETAIAANAGDPHTALAAAFDAFLAAAAAHPLVRAITTGAGADELLELVTTRGLPVMTAATDRLSTLIRDTWPQASAADADLLAEVLVRLAISTATLPGGRRGLTGRSLAEVLGPFADHALGKAGRPGG